MALGVPILKHIRVVYFYNAVMCPKDAVGMANSVVPDHTNPI